MAYAHNKLKLTTIESFEIRGRGTAHVVRPPIGSLPVRAWVGRDAVLDGRPVKIVGVETYPLPDDAEALKGPCAVLVEDRS
jgi:hypothetical protein